MSYYTLLNMFLTIFGFVEKAVNTFVCQRTNISYWELT